MMKAQKIGCILILAVLLLGAGFHGHRMKAYTAESYLVQPGDHALGNRAGASAGFCGDSELC